MSTTKGDEVPPPKRPGKEGQKTPNEVLIDHADRLWTAATENASRLSARSQILAAAMIGLLGLGFFSFVWLQQTPVISLCPAWIVLSVHIALCTVVVLFAFALGKLYYRPDDNSGQASDAMEFVKGDADEAKSQTRIVVFEKIYRAYLDLRERNEEEQKQLLTAQSLFSWGVLLLLTSILLYLIGSLPAKMYPEAVNYEYNQQQHGITPIKLEKSN